MAGRIGQRASMLVALIYIDYAAVAAVWRCLAATTWTAVRQIDVYELLPMGNVMLA